MNASWTTLACLLGIVGLLVGMIGIKMDPDPDFPLSGRLVGHAVCAMGIVFLIWAIVRWG